jgi:hypothetical protein
MALPQGIFSVVFQDNMFGFISLNQFMQMIRFKYKNDSLDITLEDDLNIKDKNLLKLILNHFKDTENQEKVY